jgi:hypothetical protein
VQSFKNQYRTLFATLGYPLDGRTATPSKVIAAAEKRLGIKVPAALRDYYLVAGRERRFNQCLNRLLPPQDWTIDRDRLLFMEESQRILWWGVSIRNAKTNDPQVSQGINDEPICWRSERRKCSTFLTFMIQYHAANGGLPYAASGFAPDPIAYRFDLHGWTAQSEVGSVFVCCRANQVVCLTPPGDLPFMQDWSITAAAKSKSELQAIGEEIGVRLT